MSERDYLSELNPPQKAAVLHDKGPLLILAGAGSGKTRVITYRIAYLIKKLAVSPYSILAITFTNKAANEMKERIHELIGSVADSMWLGTFHSMFVRILRRHAELLGYTKTFTIADTADSLAVIKRVMQDLNIDTKRVAPKDVRSLISSAKNNLVDPERYIYMHERSSFHDSVSEIYRVYMKSMLADNCMDFDDILWNTFKLFKENEEVLREYQERFQYVMVDEYQDTNQVQYKIVKALASAHKNICVVGDDDQSIYAFRGADVRNILDFEKDYKNCKLIKLEQNYRSTDNILGAANSLIANNKSRKHKKLWTEEQAGDKLVFIRAYNHFDEGKFIAKEISKAKQKEPSLQFNDFVILYRANALSRFLEAALREESIPYRIYGGLRFYDRKEIKDVLAYLRLIISDRDSLAFLRASQNPRRGIGSTSLDTIQAISAKTGQTMLEICSHADDYEELGRAGRRLNSFALLIYSMRKTLLEGNMSFKEFVEYVQRESGLETALKDEVKKSGEKAEERLENFKELLSDVVEFSNSLKASFIANENDEAPDLSLTEELHEFLMRSALYSSQDIETDEDDFVRLMTIHAAKGLEFKYVFLVAVENGIFPSSRSMVSESDVEEERRLAYVAITRAQKRLYITTAHSRTLYGQTQSFPISMFVREIPRQYIAAYGASKSDIARMRQNADTGFKLASDKLGDKRKDPLKKPDMSKGFDPEALSFLKSKQGKWIEGKQEQSEKTYLAPKDVSIGLKVQSERYGSGCILSVQSLASDAIVEVQFSDTRPKKMLLKQAKLFKGN